MSAKKRPTPKPQTPEPQDTNTVTVNLGVLAKEILEKARAKGVEHTYMFTTTFKRYQEHISHLIALEDVIANEGTIVTKEYVKDRPNKYVNPAMTAYNQTAGAADKTAQLLLKYIVAPLSDSEEDAFTAF